MTNSQRRLDILRIAAETGDIWMMSYDGERTCPHCGAPVIAALKMQEIKMLKARYG